ncbi:MAG: oligosaccharide flippase family protein [Cyanobacteria bacterium J06638_22]
MNIKKFLVVRPIFDLLSRLQGNFAHRILTLSAGMIIGQGILILLTPILTRLYSPEEFGVFAIVGGIVALLATIVAMRFEFAIPICEDEDSARSVCCLAVVTTVLMTISVGLGIWFIGTKLAQELGTPDIEPLLWFVPLALFAWGIGSILNYWALRQGRFRAKSFNPIIQYSVQGTSQVSLGLAGMTGIGLVIGLAVGHFLRMIHFIWIVPRREWHGFVERASWTTFGRSFREHWRYPVFVGSSSLFTTAIQLLPVILISALYGPVLAGMFGLTQRVVALPTRLISDAASQAFVFQGRNYEPNEFHRFFKRTSLAFFVLALIILSPLLVAGPDLFGFVFGEQWTRAGSIAQLLVPINAARFVFAPVSQSLNIVGRQEFHVIATGLLMLALVASFGAGWWFELEAMQTIMVYSFGSTTCYLVYFIAAWQQSGKPPRRQTSIQTNEHISSIN